MVLERLLKRYKVLAKPAKASLWFIVCYVIQRGLQFIAMPIYTRIMPTTEYGIYSVFLSWFNLICVFSSLSIYHGTFNKAMVKYEDDRERYISSIQYLTLIVGGGFSAAIIIFQKQIYYYTGYNIKFLLLFCLQLLLYPTLQYWSQKQRFLFEYKKLVLVTLINSVASLVFGIFFVLISDDKSFVLVEVTVVVQAVINMVLFVSIAVKGKSFCVKEYWKWTLATAIPLIPHYLSEIMLGHADRLMINSMCGASQAGIYNIVYQISMVMTIIRTGINGSFTPWLYYSIREKKFEDIRKVTKVLAVIMGYLTLIFILLGPEILRLAAPSSYYEAVVDIPAIMIGCFFIFVYVLFMNVEIYYEKNQNVALASIIAAVVNVVLNYFCIKRFGYLAAGYTTMISYLLMAVMHYYFMKHISKKHTEILEFFDTKFILLISTGLILLGLIIFLMYEFFVIRWSIIIIMTLVVLKNRTIITQLIIKIKK